MSNIYAGFDLSLSGTGYVVINGKGGVVEKGTIKTLPTEPIAKRIALIADSVVRILQQHRPDLAVKEAPVLYLRFGAVDIGQMHGAVVYAIEKAGLEQPTLVSPSTLKKFATGSGKAEKSDMKMAVLEKWSEKFSDDNQCDAYAAAKLAGVVHGGIKTSLKYESECAQTVAAKMPRRN